MTKETDERVRGLIEKRSKNKKWRISLSINAKNRPVQAFTKIAKSKEFRKRKSRLMKVDNPMDNPINREKVRQSKLGKPRPDMIGDNNPMHRFKGPVLSKFGIGKRRDLDGLFVRSTWEANIARFFNHMEIRFEYEPQSFELSNGKTYRPDFYLPEYNKFIEVKGFPGGMDRYRRFRKEYPEYIIEMIGPKEYRMITKKVSNRIPSWEGGKKNAVSE